MDQREIMIEIHDEELPDLADMYKPYENDIPQVYSFIQNCIKAKKIGMSNFVTVMSPENCWRNDGTFFAVIKQNGHDIFIHSLDDSGENITKGILNTQKFKFPPNQGRSHTMLFAIHEKFYPKIEDTLISRLQLKTLFETRCIMYSLQKEKALKATISIPSDIYIKEIDPSEAYILDRVWPHKYPGSEKMLAIWLRLNKGYGIYLKSNDKLVSWIILSCLGQLALLQTLEEHKHKGYGQLITKFMCKKLAENGFHSFATVTVGNRPSELLFQKLDFKKLGLCMYTGVQM